MTRLRNLQALDSAPDRAFDEITALASSICGTPVALISLVDEKRQWFMSRKGLALSETSRDIAFCAHTLLVPNDVTMVPDACVDERFRDNPLVIGPIGNFRFYAGAPIVTHDGFALGTVCVLDTEVRALSAEQTASLQSLASLVATLLENAKRQREHERLLISREHQESEMMQVFLAGGLDFRCFMAPDYTYRFMNQAYLDFWKVKSDDVIGKRVPDLVGQEQFDRIFQPMLARALAGELVHYEAMLDVAPAGKQLFEILYQPARGEAGTVIGVLIQGRNIQARRDREVQLKEAVAMLERRTLEQERFIHIVSHDLREPINTINNFSGLLASDEAIQWPGHARRYLDFVVNGGQRMERLLNDLLEFVRLDRQTVRYQRVELSQLANEVCEDLALSLERSDGQVLTEKLPPIWGDASLLRVLLQNLVSNALKFARAGVPPRIRISAQAEGDQLCIRVEDNGIGIAGDNLDAIFRIFKRLNPRDKYPGSGLGLSICRRVAELHQGTISATSEPGQGSCFTLKLPRGINI